FWRVAAETVTFGQKKISMKEFSINPERITKQMFFMTVTAQIVNFGTEAVLPYVKRKLTNKAKQRGIVGKAAKPVEDAEEEASFLAKVRAETELEVYDVTTDYREMVIQFGKSQRRLSSCGRPGTGNSLNDPVRLFTHVLYQFPH
ncbi:anoctamin, partial [Candidatus Bathyarchaeota archaeon]|nr:anoctamin [Candidatus Bathyarchaeota archaeon]